MKLIFTVAPSLALLVLTIFLPVRAEELAKTEPTVKSLTAEVLSLKMQVLQLQLAINYDTKVCGAAIQAAREFVTGQKGQVQARPVASTNQRPQVEKKK